MADTDIGHAKTWGNEDLTPTNLNSEFTNVYTNHLSKSTAQSVTAVKTFTASPIFDDNIGPILGTGSDAKLSYDGTNVVLDPRVVGSGVFQILNEAEVRGDAGAAGILTLSTAETTVVDGDILGRVDFQAPLEASGTDAILVAASIWAEADDTFAAGINDADLVFAVAESETALERMRLSYDGTDVALVFTGGDPTLSCGSGDFIISGASLEFDDSEGVTFGTGKDATIQYDGTDLNVNPDAVGSGRMAVLGNASVGILGTDGTLHVHTATAGNTTANVNADDLVVENSGHTGISILSGNTSVGSLYFGDDGDDLAGVVNYDHNTNIMNVGTVQGSAVTRIYSGNANVTAVFDASGSIHVGTAALATNATDGFLYISSMAGAPSGTPTDHSNLSAIVHDTTNNRIYLYDHVSNAWAYAALT